MKYWHELSDEEIDSFLSIKTTWKYIADNFKQPDWCSYPRALDGAMGCWSLVDIGKKRRKINRDFCKDCDYYKNGE